MNRKQEAGIPTVNREPRPNFPFSVMIIPGSKKNLQGNEKTLHSGAAIALQFKYLFPVWWDTRAVIIQNDLKVVTVRRG